MKVNRRVLGYDDSYVRLSPTEREKHLNNKVRAAVRYAMHTRFDLKTCQKNRLIPVDILIPKDMHSKSLKAT